MALEIVLDGVEFSSVEVTRFTTWRHAEVFDSQGASVVVEYSDPSDSERAASTIEQLLDQVRGKAVRDESVIVGLPGQEPADLGPRNPVTVAISALRTAVVELEAVHRGASLTETLGGTSQDSVELYANINRALLTEDRSASSFAAEAERAAARGFKTIKCAPFDEVVQPLSPDSAFQEARTGIDRVAAVREAVGPDVKVLVDCHRRFDVESAPRVAEALARLDVGWFEEPVDPMSDTEAHAQIAAQVRMPVAGGEGGYGEPFFADLLHRKAVDVIMPDIELCGGVAEAQRAGQTTLRTGGGFSLHSPSGPASLLAGGHVTAAVPGAMPLEHAVNEAAWRAELLDPPERIEHGRLWFPGGPRQTAKLNPDVVERYGRRWSA